MKTFVLSALILIFIIFVTFISISYIKSLYRARLNETDCRCKSISTKKVGPRNRVERMDVQWAAIVFEKEKSKKAINETYRFLCLGAVVTRLFVLTIASCVKNYSIDKSKFKSLYAGAGLDHYKTKIYESPDNHRKVVRIKIHHEFSGNEQHEFQYNLALLKLIRPFEFNDKTNIYPACLLDEKEKKFDSNFIITDYGHSNEEDILTMIIEKQDDENCGYKKMLCIQGQNLPNNCASEWGSLLHSKMNSEFRSIFYLIGIASFGVTPKDVQLNCKRNTVFTSIYDHLSWIEMMVENDLMCLTNRFRYDSREFFNYLLLLTLSTVFSVFLFFVIQNNWKIEGSKEVEKNDFKDDIGDIYKKLRKFSHQDEQKNKTVAPNDILESSDQISRPIAQNVESLDPSLEMLENWSVDPKVIKTNPSNQSESSD